MTSEQDSLNHSLARTIETFDQNRANAGILRRMSNESPAAFVNCGLEILRQGIETEGSRYVTILLLKMPQFFTALCDPRKLSYDEAIHLSTRLMNADATFDTRLAQSLPGRGAATPDTLQGAAAERALDILDQLSTGQRVIPILNHLISYPDTRISSKVALLLGKRIQNPGWAKRIIVEGLDSRLRANAIESVWGSRLPAVVEMFREHLEDGNHRVVGNCIVGLWAAGETDAASIAAGFATDARPEFRMAAAWTMGKVGDAASVAILTPLLKDAHAGVRRAALRSLGTIRETEKRAANGKAGQESASQQTEETEEEHLAREESLAA